jgi:TonB family protein
MVLTSALLLSQAGAAYGATPLQPSGKWNVSNGDTLCIASRSYGSPAGPVSLSIVPSPNGETYELLVASRYSAGERAIEEQGSVDFGSGPVKAWGLFYQTANKSSDVHDFRVPAVEMARAESAPDMTLHIADSSDFTFALDSMPEVLSELGSCTAELQRRWNMDKDQNSLFSKFAHADLRSVFSPEDYPIQAIRKEQGGTGQYLLLVDEKGKVDGCQVLQATGAPVLDVTACVVIENKAKFTPALDKSGRPVRSAIITPPINWKVQ